MVRSGELFFGGIYGFNFFRPEEIRDNPHIPPVVITAFRRGNRFETVRDLEALCKGVIRALAKAGGFAAKVTGIVEATAWETTAGYEGCGQGARKRKRTDKRGKRHAIEGTI